MSFVRAPQLFDDFYRRPTTYQPRYEYQYAHDYYHTPPVPPSPLPHPMSGVLELCKTISLLKPDTIIKEISVVDGLTILDQPTKSEKDEKVTVWHLDMMGVQDAQDDWHMLLTYRSPPGVRGDSMNSPVYAKFRIAISKERAAGFRI